LRGWRSESGSPIRYRTTPTTEEIAMREVAAVLVASLLTIFVGNAVEGLFLERDGRPVGELQTSSPQLDL
jgi:hypothetical protein